MTSTTTTTNTPFIGLLCLSVWLYLAFNAGMQLAVSPTADLDQAEQLMLSQQWAWGYTSQPPLYTWLVLLLFQITGVSLAALLALKVVLLASLAGIVLAIGRFWAFNNKQLLLSVAGLALIPQFIWEAQRDLTHSLLVTVIAALSLWQVLRLAKQPSAKQYALLGVCIGLGMLAKYNYVLFATALLLAVMSLPTWRPLLISRAAWPRVLLTIGVALAVFAPHAWWALKNIEQAAGSAHKLESAGLSWLSLGEPLLAALAFLTPFCLVAVPLLFTATSRSTLAFVQSQRRFLLQLGWLVLLVALLFMLLTGAQNFKDRWYQPLLFFAPLLMAAYVVQPRPWAYRVYMGLAVVMLLAATFILPGRILWAADLDKVSRPNLPYQALTQTLRQSLQQQQAAAPISAVLAEGRLLGGNIRLNWPQMPVFSPDSTPQLQILAGAWLVLCETADCVQQAGFKLWLQAQGVSVPQQTTAWSVVQQPLYYYPSKQHSLYWTVLPAEKTQ